MSERDSFVLIPCEGMVLTELLLNVPILPFLFIAVLCVLNVAVYAPLIMFQVCDPEEDLYVFDDEDYSEDVSLAVAQLGQYQAFPTYPPNYANYRGMTGILGTPSSVSYPAPPSGSQTPLVPPQTAIGGFFRGVDPAAASLMYPPTLGYYAGQGALPFSEGQQLPNFGSAGPGIPAQVGSLCSYSTRDSCLAYIFPEAHIALNADLPLNSLNIN